MSPMLGTSTRTLFSVSRAGARLGRATGHTTGKASTAAHLIITAQLGLCNFATLQLCNFMTSLPAATALVTAWCCAVLVMFCRPLGSFTPHPVVVHGFTLKISGAVSAAVQQTLSCRLTQQRRFTASIKKSRVLYNRKPFTHLEQCCLLPLTRLPL